MTRFYDLVTETIALLRREGRVSYRALRRQFGLDDEYLEDIKFELIRVKRQAVDQDGEMLVWVGDDGEASRHAERPSAEPGAPDSGTTGHPPTEAQRRHITVMFCDLVESTRLSSQLDPEDLQEVVRAYRGTCAMVVEQLDGHIAQYLGDGLLIYFGYPHAHENDAQRAALAGLRIVAAVANLNQRLKLAAGMRLATRVGIHTGLVVVGELTQGTEESLALGVTPNLAARIEGVAQPDTVLVSPDTRRLIEGSFECREQGSYELKGVPGPVWLYRVLRESDVDCHPKGSHAANPAPLVGREDDLRLLLGRWQKVKNGEGQAVVLCGEAGIGKSRLVEEIEQRVRQEGHERRRYRCSPYHQNTALHPFIEHLERSMGFGRDDTADVKLGKLEEALQVYGSDVTNVLPLVASLLSMPVPEGRYPPLNLSPQRQRQETQQALVRWLVEEPGPRPALVVFEDLHWADPSTLDVLGLLFEGVPSAPIMVLLTFRQDLSPPWASRAHFTQLTLGGLSRREVKAIIDRVAGGKALPPEVVGEVAARTDGVPLFVEELTKMVLESGQLKEGPQGYELRGHLSALAIPVTLQDSLTARLDRLGDAREVAQLCATLGREFTYDLALAVSPLPAAALERSLHRLVDSELIHQRGVPPHASYGFRHALIQNAAYESLLKRRRQAYHRKIVGVLGQRFPEIADAQPELLAYHCTEAGLAQEALGHWCRAGEKAMQRSAHLEAIHHLTQGLDLLDGLPDTPERAHQELRLRMALGPALIAIKGYGATDVESSYARARELCRVIGETPELSTVLVGLEAFYLLHGELDTARDLSDQMLSVAERRHEGADLMVAHSGAGVALFYLGEFDAALAHLERGIALYDRQQHRMLAFQDPGVACLSWAAMVLWILGYPEQALQRSEEALALAEDLAHPFSVAAALNWVARVHLFRREVTVAHRRARQMTELSVEQGFPFFAANGTVMDGWALAQEGRVEEGIATIERGLATWRATGAELGGSFFLGLLAEAHACGGQPDKGLEFIEEALSMAERTGERWWEADLHRQRGVLLWDRDPGEAESSLLRALAVARQQRARSLELRAAMALVRARNGDGQGAEARRVLAEVRAGFSEGFGTSDLRDAEALLDEPRRS